MRKRNLPEDATDGTNDQQSIDTCYYRFNTWLDIERIDQSYAIKYRICVSWDIQQSICFK